jgi:hypothetical protein
MSQNSKYGTLNKKDGIKLAIIAALGTLISTVLAVIQQGGNLNKEVLISAILGAIIAGLPYITKNTFTNSLDQPFIKEPFLNNNKLNSTLIKKLIK